MVTDYWFNKQWHVLITFCIINIASHFFILNAPPCGVHVWRQCNTLAMSKNFTTEGFNILEPKIDRRNETNGITGSHFPLYEFGLGLIHKVMGFNNIIPRIYSLLIFSIGVFAFYKILLSLGLSSLVSFLGALLISFNPILYYDSANAMPDILALSIALWSLYYLIIYSKKGTTIFLIGATFLAILAGLIKFQFLIIPFASIVYFKWQRKPLFLLSISTLITSLVVYNWYNYALKLTEKNNLREYGLWIKPISFEEKMTTLINNLLIDIPELILGWPLLIALLYWAILLFKKIKITQNILFVFIGFLSFIIFYFVAIERFKHHSYYFISVIPFMVIGFILLLNKSSKAINILTIIIFLQIIWTTARIIPSRWTKEQWQLPTEFSDNQLLNQLKSSIPNKHKVVIGSDLSGCVYFYFTQTKGYSFENIDELISLKNGIPYFEIMRRNNVKYLIVNEENTDLNKVKSLQGIKLYNKIGNFSVWELESVQ